VLHEAADGRFPPVDGVAEVMPPDHAGAHAVVSFTGHAYVLTDRSVAGIALDGFGAATAPAVLLALAGSGGEVGSLDVVLTRRGTGGSGVSGGLVELDLDDHPRVRRAMHHRRDVVVTGDDRGIVCTGRGLTDRLEISVELTGATPASGVGRALIASALAQIDRDEAVFAQVAPGNAVSLRAFLACGFVPIGSEVVIEPAG
jgi:hypothetical protein